MPAQFVNCYRHGTGEVGTGAAMTAALSLLFSYRNLHLSPVLVEWVSSFLPLPCLPLTLFSSFFFFLILSLFLPKAKFSDSF